MLGTQANYGARLAASEINVSRGGKQLSDQEANENDAISRVVALQEFKSKSLAYRLFNPYDPKTAAAKLFDVPDPQITGNIAKVSDSIFGVGKMFAAIPSLLSGTARAAAPLPYDYGFPEFGFSAAEIDNDATYNPYENAKIVASSLDSNTSAVPFLNERVKNCFGVNLVKSSVRTENDVVDAWGVSHVGTDEAPKPYDQREDGYKKNDCASSEIGWLRIRMFIYDTTTMDALSCFVEDDEQSCANVGFTQTASSGSTGAGGCFGGADMSPGTPPDEYRQAIIDAAPGLSNPECGEEIKARYPTAVPNDGLHQYFASIVQEGNIAECERINGFRCIAVKYRDPPNSNTIPVPIDGGGSGGGPPKAPEPPPVCDNCN